MERPGKQTTERQGVGESARKLCALWEGDQREAKIRTGLGKAPRPGSQGGRRKRGPRWHEAPTSRIERARGGNSPPTVVRAADLSRPPTEKDYHREVASLLIPQDHMAFLPAAPGGTS